MKKVEKIALIFIDYMNSLKGGITNLQLNKLLYFAQGHSLAINGRPLFDDDIQAWEYGAVVPRIYHKYKGFSKKNMNISSDISKSEINSIFFDFDEKDRDIMIDVLDEYSKYPANKLVDLCHEKGSPWEKVFNRNKRGTKISNDEMKNYFVDKHINTLDECIERMPLVKGDCLPKEWYDPKEDEIWNEYLQ